MAAMAKLDDAHARLAASGADDDLVELAIECLMPAPAARPPSAEAVASAIHEHLASAEARIHDARVEAAEANVRATALKRTQRLGIALTVVIAAGLAASLWFWRDADSQGAIAEKAATSEKEAREQADEARDAAQSNLDNFNRLSHVVRLEAAKALEEGFYPAWPSKSDKMRLWLDNEAQNLTGALPELRATLATLEERAVPLTDEDKAGARRAHPRGAELTNLENKSMYLPVSRATPSLATSGLSIGVCPAGSTSRSDTEGLAPVISPTRWITLGAGPGPSRLASSPAAWKPRSRTRSRESSSRSSWGSVTAWLRDWPQDPGNPVFGHGFPKKV